VTKPGPVLLERLGKVLDPSAAAFFAAARSAAARSVAARSAAAFSAAACSAAACSADCGKVSSSVAKAPVRYLLQSESRVARSVRDVLGWASARPTGRHQRRTMHVITVRRSGAATPLCTSTSVRVRIGGG
jgi:hypothetical protein